MKNKKELAVRLFWVFLILVMPGYLFLFMENWYNFDVQDLSVDEPVSIKSNTLNTLNLYVFSPDSIWGFEGVDSILKEIKYDDLRSITEKDSTLTIIVKPVLKITDKNFAFHFSTFIKSLPSKYVFQEALSRKDSLILTNFFHISH